MESHFTLRSYFILCCASSKHHDTRVSYSRLKNGSFPSLLSVTCLLSYVVTTLRTLLFIAQHLNVPSSLPLSRCILTASRNKDHSSGPRRMHCFREWLGYTLRFRCSQRIYHTSSGFLQPVGDRPLAKWPIQHSRLPCLYQGQQVPS
jgi:hypothetical protein